MQLFFAVVYEFSFEGDENELSSKKKLFNWMISFFLISIVLVMVIIASLFSTYKVEGLSMEPTLYNQERILVSKSSKDQNYHRGDIVVINGKDNEKFIKRIIGIPGDKIEVKDDILYINDIQQEERYLNNKQMDVQVEDIEFNGEIQAVVIPENKYFVMGDNRILSLDSRNGLGLIKQDHIIGESKYVFYPFSDFRKID